MVAAWRRREGRGTQAHGPAGFSLEQTQPQVSVALPRPVLLSPAGAAGCREQGPHLASAEGKLLQEWADMDGWVDGWTD